MVNATSPEYIDAAIAQSYQLESLLRVLSLAADGEHISNMTLERAGAGSIIDLAAEMAGKITDGLELSKK